MSTKFPAKLDPSEVTVIVDSREQTPLDLSPLKVVRGTLDTADYALEACPDVCRVERKSLDDLVACVGRERERFDREIQRLLSYPVRILVIESTWAAIDLAQWRGKITSEQVIGSLLAWESMGVSVHMCHDHERAGRHVARLLYTIARRRFRELRAFIQSSEASHVAS